MGWPTAMAASFLATLGRPRWWAIALAAFLVRGGVLALVLPMVALPSRAGIENIVSPTIVSYVLVGPTASFWALVVGGAAAALGLLVLGALVGSWLDLALVREVAADDELEAALPVRRRRTLHATAIRLAAHLPTMVIVIWSAFAVGEAAYREVVAPGDPSVPVFLRVVARVPAAIVAVTAAWALGEAIGGLAVRRQAAGARTVAALASGWLDLLRRPAVLATALLTDLAVASTVVLSALAVGLAWDSLRIAVVDGSPAFAVRLGLLVFGLAWVVGAWSIGVATAWRQAAWTFEALRPRHESTRTIVA